jgi:flagellar motor switch protein FliG
MLGYLKSLLEEEDFYRFEDAVTNSRYAAESEKEDALRQYRDHFVRHRTQHIRKLKMEKGKDIFQFLQQLNNNQLYQLIKDESEDMSAILLAQMPPQQTVELLRYFDIAKQTILLQRMSNISNVPTSMYKDVANKFSRKAIAVKDMGNVAVDGLASILNILNTLPLQQQDAYIEDIAKYDLDLARKIKEHFLTFDGLLELDPDKLLRSLEGIGGSDLAKALTGAKPPLIALVLDSKTQRERDIIEAEMQLNAQLSTEEIEAARVVLLAAIKEKLKR